jgi:hypothetical protein
LFDEGQVFLDIEPLDFLDRQIGGSGIGALNQSAFNGAWHESFLVTSRWEKYTASIL